MSTKRPPVDKLVGGNAAKKKKDSCFQCSRCRETIEFSDTETGNAICAECGGDFGCFECSMDEGGWCGTCNEFTCFDCPGHPTACDECLEQLCDECGNFKPGKNGTKRCHSCQPWWQQNKPASAFCRDCGSQRSGAGFCQDCGARICEECEYFRCSGCHEEFYCKDCNRDGLWCEQCVESGGDLFCVDCCEGHAEEGEEEEDTE